MVRKNGSYCSKFAFIPSYVQVIFHIYPVEMKIEPIRMTLSNFLRVIPVYR